MASKISSRAIDEVRHMVHKTRNALDGDADHRATLQCVSRSLLYPTETPLVLLFLKLRVRDSLDSAPCVDRPPAPHLVSTMLEGTSLTRS